jgi:hypothetical protein
MLSMYLSLRKVMIPAVMLSLASLLVGCADAEGPRPRDANIPPPRGADTRTKAVNERPDPVMYLPLGRDVLVPRAEDGTLLPATVVGPFELRGETLAGALQLILDGTNVPVAFEATAGLENTITVTNLKGPLDVVVSEVCSLANLYCSYRNGMVVVKDTEIFTVTIPPIVASDSMAQLLTNIAAAIGNITGQTPITDASTRTIVYRASQRTSELASRYFQRLRSNTALIVFETYIWEVSLDAGSAAGIRWSALDQFKKFNVGINLPGELAQRSERLSVLGYPPPEIPTSKQGMFSSLSRIMARLKPFPNHRSPFFRERRQSLEFRIARTLWPLFRGQRLMEETQRFQQRRIMWTAASR